MSPIQSLESSESVGEMVAIDDDVLRAQDVYQRPL